jgi:phosphoglycolate phosphatase-like HAD superfamily hydrolase
VSASDASPGQPAVLVLWDIDHTLLAAQGVGAAVYRSAFQAATGKPMRVMPRFAGRTELAIMRETLIRNEVAPTDDAISELTDRLVEGFERARDELADRGRVLPGAAATLAALAGDGTVYQSVLTGNLREVARIKLEVFGLDAHLDLASGAYGEDHTDRAELVGFAQYRASRRFAVPFDNARTVLIGDTLNDVRAALAAGVAVIGVATGENESDDLRSAGAGVVLTALDPDSVRRSLFEMTLQGPR